MLSPWSRKQTCSLRASARNARSRYQDFSPGIELSAKDVEATSALELKPRFSSLSERAWRTRSPSPPLVMFLTFRVCARAWVSVLRTAVFHAKPHPLHCASDLLFESFPVLVQGQLVVGRRLRGAWCSFVCQSLWRSNYTFVQICNLGAVFGPHLLGLVIIHRRKPESRGNFQHGKRCAFHVAFHFYFSLNSSWFP